MTALLRLRILIKYKYNHFLQIKCLFLIFILTAYIFSHRFLPAYLLFAAFSELADCIVLISKQYMRTTRKDKIVLNLPARLFHERDKIRMLSVVATGEPLPLYHYSIMGTFHRPFFFSHLLRATGTRFRT
jgi:hypothetical protein